MAITASGPPESGRIVEVGPDFLHSIRFRVGYFFLAHEVARIIAVGSESDPFLYIWPGSHIDAFCRIRLD